MAVSQELKPLLRAVVVDIRDDSIPIAAAYTLDANVLTFSTYDRYEQRRLLSREHVPGESKVAAYARYEQRARAAGSRLCASLSAVYEFLRTVEFIELELLWARLDADAAAGDLSGFEPKRVRRQGGQAYADVQQKVATYLRAVDKRFLLLQPIAPLIALVGALEGNWFGTVLDLGDAHLLADGRAADIAHIISDDQDFATLGGVTLYTTNTTCIDTARAVGQLMTRRR